MSADDIRTLTLFILTLVMFLNVITLYRHLRDHR